MSINYKKIGGSNSLIDKHLEKKIGHLPVRDEERSLKLAFGEPF